MSEDLVIRHCAPTLAGIKTGNLFSCACPCKAALTKELCRLNRKLVPKGIRILPLKVPASLFNAAVAILIAPPLCLVIRAALKRAHLKIA